MVPIDPVPPVDFRLKNVTVRTKHRWSKPRTILENVSVSLPAGTLTAILGGSGSEKRRTSIGIQLLANPSGLFCDERTTGLYSHSAFQVVQTLKSLAQTGKTIIISIHAPRSEIWDLFDRVILLSQGHMLFAGSPEAAISHFSVPEFVNPAEHLVDVAAIDTRSEAGEKESLSRIQAAKDAWNSSAGTPEKEPASCPASPSKSKEGSISPTTDNTEVLLAEKGGKPLIQDLFTDLCLKYQAIDKQPAVGFFTQVSAMTRRSIKTTLRDPIELSGSFFQAVLMAVIYGWIFFRLGNDRAGIRSREGALNIATYQSYLTLMFEIYRLTVDIRLFDLERKDDVASVSARRLSKVLLQDIPVPTMFAIIFYFMAGLRSGSFFIFLLVVVACQYNSAVTLACACVGLSRDFAVASLIGNMAFTIQFFATGYIIQSQQLPIYLAWLKWISYSSYSYNVIAIIEFSGASLGCLYTDTAKAKGLYILQSLGIQPSSLHRDLALSLVFPLIFTAIAWVFFQYFETDIKATRSKQARKSDNKSFLGNPGPLLTRTSLPTVVAIENFELNVRSLCTRKTILHPINADVQPGKINVIIGPSGSGKTSLLRGLSMVTQSTISTEYLTSGQITLNSVPASANMIKAAVSFVPQDDDGLMPSLTVRETLRYAAGIRLPSTLSKEEKIQRAESLLQQMCLSHCADSFIGSQTSKGISGG